MNRVANFVFIVCSNFIFVSTLLLGSTKMAQASDSPSRKANIHLVHSQEWAAFVTSNEPKSCFVVSMPQSKEPPYLSHGNVLFFVVTKPDEGISKEPSIQVEYPFKKGSDVLLEVDEIDFKLFARGNTAWLETTKEEMKMIAAMKKGKKAVVRATSARGNNVKYEFSLMGVTSALNAAEKECR